MWTANFWKATAERAIKSFCQGLLVLWGADSAFDIVQVDIKSALGIAAGYAVISILTSIVSANIGPSDSPSVTESK
jgi:hypothetical protein